jgi:hypothetical protein
MLLAASRSREEPPSCLGSTGKAVVRPGQSVADSAALRTQALLAHPWAEGVATSAWLVQHSLALAQGTALPGGGGGPYKGDPYLDGLTGGPSIYLTGRADWHCRARDATRHARHVLF